MPATRGTRQIRPTALVTGCPECGQHVTAVRDRADVWLACDRCDWSALYLAEVDRLAVDDWSPTCL